MERQEGTGPDGGHARCQYTSGVQGTGLQSQAPSSCGDRGLRALGCRSCSRRVPAGTRRLYRDGKVGGQLNCCAVSRPSRDQTLALFIS